MSTRKDRKVWFIRLLAEYLAGPNSAKHSIGLELGKEDSKEWAKLRDATPLFGYPSVKEAQEILTEFLS